MIFRHKKEVYTVKEFLAGKHNDSNHCQTSHSNYTPAYGFMGMDITHKSFFNSSFNDPYFIVFAVAGIALLSTFLEHRCRAKGNENTADNIATVTKLLFPIAFYIFLYFGIVTTF